MATSKTEEKKEKAEEVAEGSQEPDQVLIKNFTKSKLILHKLSNPAR